MVTIKEVAEKTYLMDVKIDQVDIPFTVYLIKEKKGVLIEPGPAATIPSIQKAMRQIGMTKLDYIIPTHIHMDHAGAIGSLSRLFPHAEVLLHPSGAKHAIDPSRLIESTKMAFGDDFEKSYGPLLPVPESQVKTPGDGDIISVDGRELQIIYTPGHAPHHLSIFDQKTKGLFPGEALGVPMPGAKISPIPAAAPPSFDIENYLKSMEKLKGLCPHMLFYSHDGVGRNPEELISSVAGNTKTVGDIILKALKEGMTNEAIKSRLREEVGMDDEMTLTGFVFYFKKRGLV
jgi:glyoxylase-like metal-dependent hydrolase (beta-lactamase superfamily II)